MLHIDCWETEKDLKTTPGAECALTSLAIDEPLEYARSNHKFILYLLLIRVYRIFQQTLITIHCIFLNLHP